MRRLLNLATSLTSLGCTGLTQRCPCSNPTRQKSSEGDVVVKECPLDGVCLLEMYFPQAKNTLSLSLISSLLAAISTVCDPETGTHQGIILTSNIPGYFCGDFDLNALCSSTEEEFNEYYERLQTLFVTLHSLPIPMMVALNGHTFAGGCLLALAADYRVMVSGSSTGDQFKIGIPTSRYGMRISPYMAGSLDHVVGFRKAETLLLDGSLLNAADAVEYGLVDEVVENPDEAILPCLVEMEKYLKMPSFVTYWLLKDAFRKKLLAPLCTPALRSADIANAFHMLPRPKVKHHPELHLETPSTCSKELLRSSP